jgi:hypothetical protein
VESEAVIADYLGMAQIAVHEVTTFYNMYNQQPVGKYKLNVCTNLPCQLRDGQKALQHLEKKLGVAMGETTADGLFTLQQCECLGACADAPVTSSTSSSMVCGLRRASDDHGCTDSFAVPSHGCSNLFPRPPHQSANLRGPGRHELEHQGLRSTWWLCCAAQDPWY